ncbi:MAG: hypothetical protein LBE20_05355 [Deltaproteobacteria bacterium]|jgi:hypothetical protein|nr:hypothetical protein [Deltaproteobacteria bacterium]
MFESKISREDILLIMFQTLPAKYLSLWQFLGSSLPETQEAFVTLFQNEFSKSENSGNFSALLREVFYELESESGKMEIVKTGVIGDLKYRLDQLAKQCATLTDYTAC